MYAERAATPIGFERRFRGESCGNGANLIVPFVLSDLAIISPGGTDSADDDPLPDAFSSSDDFDDDGYDEGQSVKRIGRDVEMSPAIIFNFRRVDSPRSGVNQVRSDSKTAPAGRKGRSRPKNTAEASVLKLIREVVEEK